MLECSFATSIPEAVVVLTAISFLVPRRMSDKTRRFRSAAQLHATWLARRDRARQLHTL
jgi:hypothetical protein